MTRRRTTLGECCQIVSGATPSSTNDEYWDGSIEWATPKDLSDLDGKYITQTARRITKAGLSSCAATVLPTQSVLFSSRAPIGHVAINLRPMATNQGFKSFVPNSDEVDPSFLYHWLRAHRAHLESLGNGATFKELSKTVVARVEIELPPLAEQRRIADLLDKADAIRRKRKAAIALTDDLLRSTFLDMFGDPVTNPKGWPLTTLGAEASEMKYGTSEKCGAASKGGLPVLRIPNVVAGEIDWTDLKFATLVDREVEQLRLRRRDLLFVRSNGNPDYIGRCAVFDSDREALFASYLIRVRLRKGRLEPVYVRAALSAATYRMLLTSEARTTAGNYNISTEGLRRLRIPSPPVDLQTRFAEIASKIARTRRRLVHALVHGEDAFASASAAAFSGGRSSPC